MIYHLNYFNLIKTRTIYLNKQIKLYLIIKTNGEKINKYNLITNFLVLFF